MSFLSGKKLSITILLILTLIPQPGSTDELLFTYAGLNFKGGFNRITYTDWFEDERATHKSKGQYYSPGLILDVFVYDFIGEFSLNYCINKNSEAETDIMHLSSTALLKYAYPLTESLFVTIGPGLYLESPPASKKYDGGGIIATTGIIYTINWNYKIVTDFTFSYGNFGLGDNSTKMTYGLSIGIIKKFGKI